jgi:hypothetical protein
MEVVEVLGTGLAQPKPKKKNMRVPMGSIATGSG